MKWFKLHAEIKDDPKMLELDDHQFRLWIGLLSMACDSDDRGAVTGIRFRGLAAALRTTENALREALEMFAELGMIEYDDPLSEIIITNWDRRQYDKPSDTPDATRDRKRRSRASHAMSRPCHATDTDTESEQNRTEQNRTDERDAARAPALTGENHAPDGVVNSNAPKPRRKFEPPAPKTVSEFFKSNGSTGAEARFYFDHYTGNGWRVGPNPMRDWQATARNWIRRSGNGKPVIPEEVEQDEAERSAQEAQERADAERARNVVLQAEREQRRERLSAIRPPPVAESEGVCAQ